MEPTSVRRRPTSYPLVAALLCLVGLFCLHAEGLAAGEETGGGEVPASRGEEIRERWNAIAPGQREVLLRRYEAWKRLSPAEREEIRRRLRYFRSLPKERRERILKNYEAFQRLPVEQRKAILENYVRWKAMSPEERARLKRTYRKFLDRLSPEERRRIRREYHRFRRLPPATRKRILEKARKEDLD